MNSIKKMILTLNILMLVSSSLFAMQQAPHIKARMVDAIEKHNRALLVGLTDDNGGLNDVHTFKLFYNNSKIMDWRITPLKYAVARGNKQLVEEFIKSGAQVNQSDDLGRTALHIAYLYDQAEIVELLLKKYANPDQKDKYKCVPAYYASKMMRATRIASL